MKITEVRVYKKDEHDKKLRAFATITFDGCFVVRDIKIIEGSKGLFVAMPSRKIKEECSQCHNRVVIGSRFCCQCGAKMRERESNHGHDPNDKQSEYRDIAHPITADFRDLIQKAILSAYEEQKHKLDPENHSTL